MSDCCKTETCIRCSVKNCIHHTMNDSCSAGEIQVGNRMSNTSDETCCDTFRLKD